MKKLLYALLAAASLGLTACNDICDRISEYPDCSQCGPGGKVESPAPHPGMIEG